MANKIKDFDGGPWALMVMQEMCEVVGIDINTINFGNPNWPEKHSWTIEQHDAFKSWLISLWRRNLMAREELLADPDNYSSDYLSTAADKFLEISGWKIKDE